MAVVSTNDLKTGMTLEIEHNLFQVVDFQHVKPGKGGAFVRTKLKNVLTGKVVDKTFNAGAKIEIENVDRRDYTYLYNDGDSFVFMDQTDYDQINEGDTVEYVIQEGPRGARAEHVRTITAESAA